MKLPDVNKWIDFKGEMGSNGQYDELALVMFFEDNPEYKGKPIDEWLQPSEEYAEHLQKNYDEREINFP